MASQKADLLLHPVRMRIVLALANRALTTRQLAAALSDVPQATLYSHLGLLAGGGLVEVVEEHRVRGAVERTYALPANAGSLGPGEGGEDDRDALFRAFATFVGTLIADFARYLSREHVDMGADGVGFRQYPLYLTDEEFEAFRAALGATLAPFLANAETPERTRRLFSTIVLPTPDGTGDQSAGSSESDVHRSGDQS